MKSWLMDVNIWLTGLEFRFVKSAKVNCHQASLHYPLQFSPPEPQLSRYFSVPEQGSGR